MAVYTESGAYGVGAGLVYSFPCEVSADGEWTIKQGLTLSPYAQEKLKVSEAELFEERAAAMEIMEKKVADEN